MADIIAPERYGRTGGPGLSYLLGAKIKNQPLAMEAGAAQQLEAAIKEKAFDAQISGPWASKFIGTKDHRSQYRVTEDGIAIIPVSGTLFDRGEWLGDVYGWMTSYEGLAEQFRRVAKDDSIKSVVLDIDSPGGMAAGLFDLVNVLVDLKKSKKVYAIAANMAASAAYAIGCAAHELHVSRLGLAGSIGVIAMHSSFARMLDQAGVDTTIIFAGDHKANGNPYQALTHAARAEMASAIDQIYEDFVRHVAKHRPIDEADVRATQARVYTGQKAVEAKLADGVKSFEELIDHIRKGSGTSQRGKSRSKGDRTVSDANKPDGARPDYDAVIAAALTTLAANAPKPQTQTPAADPAPAAAQQAPAAEQQAPKVDAAAAMKDRISAILTCDDAKERQGLANHLAFNTDLDVEAAKAVLKASSVEAKPGAASQLGTALEQRMAQPGNSAGVAPDGAADKGSRPGFSSWVKKQPGSKSAA